MTMRYRYESIGVDDEGYHIRITADNTPPTELILKKTAEGLSIDADANTGMATVYEGKWTQQ